MISEQTQGQGARLERPWLAHYEPQVPYKPEVPNIMLHELLEATVRHYPENTATIFYGSRLTYAQLNEMVARYTGVFKQLGLGPKDVVAALDTNSDRYIASYYAAAKAGLIGLTKTLARELAPHVRCNAIAPGPVATEMWFSVREDVQRQVVDREIPLKRIAQPEDIARAGLDISSWPDATGIVVVLDGGRIL